jgi:outer membrane cobalamin receptor
MSRLSRGCALALPIVLATALPASASNDAVIEGVVEDAILRPLQGATVILHDSSGNTVGKIVTGKDGTFSFPVAFGDYTVEASEQGLVGDHQHVVVNSSQVAKVELVLVAGNEVVQITEDWAVPPPPKATGSVQTVTRQKLAELPGADDRPVTDVVATQPGFVVDALGNVYARGNHANIQYQIDGIPVPDSVGSLFAASIPVRLIQAIEIFTGGIPAEYGDRLGAVVNLTTRQGGDRPDGSVQVRYGSFGTVEPGFTYSTTLGGTPPDPATPTTTGEGTGLFVGGSLLHSQRALDPPSITPILHDDGTSGRLFARVDQPLTRCDRVELFATYAHNRFQIPIDPSVVPLDPANPNLVRPVDRFGNASPPFVPHDTNASETEDELFAAVSWVHAFGPNGGRLQIAPLYKLSRGVLFGDAEHALGPLADPGTTASDVKRLAHHAGAVAAYSQKLGNHLVKAGAQADFLIGSTSFTQYMRDDAVGGIASMTTGADHTDALLTGAYVQDHWSGGDATVDVGIRVDELHVMLGDGTANDSAGVSPRAGASYALAKDTVLHGFAGIDWQPPSPLDAANAARALGVVPAGMPVTYDLKPETDLSAELGVVSRVAKPVKLGLTGWGRYAYNQLDDTVIGSTSLVSNYNFDRGRAAGLEGAVDVSVGPWLTGFANASLGVAQGRGISSAKFLFSPDQLADNTWQSLDHAQTLTANGGATVRDGRFAATALGSYGSGLRTGPANDQHVPGHVHVDVSTQYTFAPAGYPVRLGIDIDNIFDAHYAYRIANGFVGSSYGAPRSVYLSLTLPLAAEPEKKAGKP